MRWDNIFNPQSILKEAKKKWPDLENIAIEIRFWEPIRKVIEYNAKDVKKVRYKEATLKSDEITEIILSDNTVETYKGGSYGVIYRYSSHVKYKVVYKVNTEGGALEERRIRKGDIVTEEHY